jgi:xanthine/uracil/vitamin C permease (AzgA family)
MLLMPLIYSIAEGISFGILFYAISLSANNLNIQDIIGVLAISSAMFLFCGLVGSLFSLKTTFTLGLILLIASL